MRVYLLLPPVSESLFDHSAIRRWEGERKKNYLTFYFLFTDILRQRFYVFSQVLVVIYVFPVERGILSAAVPASASSLSRCLRGRCFSPLSPRARKVSSFSHSLSLSRSLIYIIQPASQPQPRLDPWFTSYM